MPKLWSETIEQHRHAVRDAVLDAMPALMEQRGIASVTMSDLAQKAGIGRATLYKYFHDLRAVMLAWHERQVSRHLTKLSEVAAGHLEPSGKLEALLRTYAFMRAEQPRNDMALNLHDGAHIADADRELHALLTGILTELATSGQVTPAVPAGELATFVLHALSAAPRLPSHEAVERLVFTTMAGLTGPPGGHHQRSGRHGHVASQNEP